MSLRVNFFEPESKGLVAWDTASSEASKSTPGESPVWFWPVAFPVGVIDVFSLGLVSPLPAQWERVEVGSALNDELNALVAKLPSEVARDSVLAHFVPRRVVDEDMRAAEATESTNDLTATLGAYSKVLGDARTAPQAYASILSTVQFRMMSVALDAIKRADAQSGPDKALEDFNAINSTSGDLYSSIAAQAKPAVVDAFLRAGEREEGRRKLTQAMKHYQKALEVANWAPADSAADFSARENIIKVARAMRPRPVYSGEDYRKYMVLGLNDVRLATDRSQYVRAIEDFKEAADLAPWVPEAYFSIGQVAREAGDNRAAAEALKLYLLAFPGAPDAREVQDQIYVLEGSSTP